MFVLQRELTYRRTAKLGNSVVRLLVTRLVDEKTQQRTF